MNTNTGELFSQNQIKKWEELLSVEELDKKWNI